MHLLSPDEITQEKKMTTEQSQARARSAAIEESKIVKSLNLIKQKSEEEKKRVKEETDAFIMEQQAKRDIALKQAQEAENRRKEAMIPINELKDALEARIEAVNEREQAIEVEKEQIAVDKQKNIDLAENLADQKSEIDDLKELWSKKISNVEREEDRITKSANLLGTKWSEYNKAVEILNKNIKENEIVKERLDIREKALDIRADQQDKTHQEQCNHDRAIKDKYETLAHAVKEVKKVYNIDIKK